MTTTFGQIWQTLSALDISAKIVEKPGTGNPSYLSWGDAWGLLMQHYPEADYRFLQSNKRYQGDEVFEALDGSAEVRCIVTIDGKTREMWLPVMDHKFNAIVDPDAREVSDAKMRCLVKCLALFGLGHSLYAKAKEDVPDESRQPRERGSRSGGSRGGSRGGPGRGQDNRSRPTGRVENGYASGHIRDDRRAPSTFNVEAAIGLLREADTLDRLNDVYDEQKAEARKRGDEAALDKLFAVYDERAAELEKR